MKIAVLTYPFCKYSNEPLEMLQNSGFEYMINDKGRKYTREELVQLIFDWKPDIIVNDTEPYDKGILDIAKNLKMLSNTGIGVDSIDLDECKSRGIVVTNTPDAPTNAVADIVIAQIINMLRKPDRVCDDLRKEKWNRYIGREVRNCAVGIIGFGRIGKAVSKRLKGFDCLMFANDTDKSQYNDSVIPATKEEIYKNCDIITLHVPKTAETIGLISNGELAMMKKNVRLLNFSRGGIIEENALYNFLNTNKKACAAIDTYVDESYHGDLIALKNAYLTAHCGSCTVLSRWDMEVTAVKNALDFASNKELENRLV